MWYMRGRVAMSKGAMGRYAIVMKMPPYRLDGASRAWHDYLIAPR